MARPRRGASRAGLSWQRIAKLVLWAVAAVAAAFLAALGTDLAGRLGLSGSDEPARTQTHQAGHASPRTLISSSSTEVQQDCAGETFLPSAVARRVLEHDPPVDDWTSIERLPGAAFVDQDTVEVSIQGESARLITLTGVRFHVTRRSRPPGEGFSRDCGDAWPGRALVVDLDKTPPRIVDSNRRPSVSVGEQDETGTLSRPIVFPWTVSVTDPLLLLIFAETRSCYCEWTAEIPWVSGSRRGVIRVGDPKKPYKVVYGSGLREHVPVGYQWNQ